MAKAAELDPQGFAAWLAERPPSIRAMVEKYPPDRLYRIDSGHRVTIRSYCEDGTVTVFVTGQYNRVLFGRTVFGIKAEELVECDLPGPDENVGDTAAEAGYSEEDVREILIPKVLEVMR